MRVRGAGRGASGTRAARFDLLFVDLDGTLVGTDETPTPRVLQALRSADEAGCRTVVCTGRSRYTARGIVDQVGRRGYGIVLNGAVTCEWETGAVVRRRTLPMALARRAIALTHDIAAAPLCIGALDDDRWVFTDRRFPLMPRYGAMNAERLVYLDDLAAELPGEPASVCAFGPPEGVAALADRCRREFAAAATVIESASPRYVYGALEVCSAEAGKAVAARDLADRLGVPRERTMAVGDHVNDLDVLAWAGLGVCMGDGHPEAQACADHITGPLREDGVAQAIERYVLRDGGR